MPVLSIFADFERAFDSISHKYILKCLDSFNLVFTREQRVVSKMQGLCIISFL